MKVTAITISNLVSFSLAERNPTQKVSIARFVFSKEVAFFIFIYLIHLMSLISILALGVALSMDALAVAIASGGSMQPFTYRQALRIAFAFGGFQALMPLLGWVAGTTVRPYIEHWDHWITFGLLTVIGGKMVYSSFHLEEAERKMASCLSGPVLLMLALATSIDALAVGLSLSMLQVFILWPALLIGLVTFGISFVGVRIGYQFGHFYEKRMEFFGGIILIGIGLKILFEHLTK